MMKSYTTAILCGIALVMAIPCQAGFFGRQSDPCAQCGCCQLKKVCSLVPDVKKVTEVKYVVDEEEVCLPGKSCTEVRIVQESCAPDCQRCEKVQTPRCGRIVCKKKLKKSTTTVEKPSLKCIVQTVCCQCGSICERGNCGQ